MASRENERGASQCPKLVVEVGLTVSEHLDVRLSPSFTLSLSDSLCRYTHKYVYMHIYI